LFGRYIYQVNAVSILSEEKREMIRQADMALVDLKLLIRLGMLFGYLPLKKYEILVGYTTEIGKMIGGWIKSVNSSIYSPFWGGGAKLCQNSVLHVFKKLSLLEKQV
jgi:hypothetical protein